MLVKVSIIIPNYNHSNFLDKRLDSIFNQTYRNFEVILLDDYSIDSSVEILKKYANHPKVAHFIINTKNSGSPFQQWNKGVTLAKGEYIWIAESDDYANKRFLEKLVPYLEENPKIGIVYCQSYIVDENDSIISSKISWTQDLDKTRWYESFINNGKNEVAKYLIIKNTIPNVSGTLIRKKSYLNAGMAPINMKMAGDWYFYLSILRQYDIAFVKNKLNYNRYHATVTRNHNTKEKILTRLIEGCVVVNYGFNHFIIDPSIKDQVRKNITKKILSKITREDLLKPKFWQLMYFYIRIDHLFGLKALIYLASKTQTKLRKNLAALK